MKKKSSLILKQNIMIVFNMLIIIIIIIIIIIKTLFQDKIKYRTNLPCSPQIFTNYTNKQNIIANDIET